MKPRYMLPLALILLAAVVFLSTRRTAPTDPAVNPVASQNKQAASSPKVSGQDQVSVEGPGQAPIEDARLTRRSDGTVLFNPAVATSRTLSQSIDPQNTISALDQLFSHYRFAYKENPVGVENFEFTEQLLGKNPLRIIFIDPESTAIVDGELVDTWGSPYFFHPESGTELEIRSAGPDRQMWTRDDISSKSL